jgi:hypothetical protein
MSDDLKKAENWPNSSTPPAMTQEQVEVFGLLRSLSTGPERFHEWYQGCLESLNSRSSDKMAQAAHSIREICDRLPQRIASIAQPKSMVSAFKSFGPDFIKIKTDHYASGWTGKIINEPLDRMLVRLELVCSERARTKRLGDALVSSDPQAEMIAKQFRDERDKAFEDIGRFFQNVAHHNHVTTEAEFRAKLELFESLLLNYLTPRTADQQQELLALMAGPPDSKKLMRVNELVLHKGANFVFFFDKLNNPQWLPVSDGAGYFSNLPEPEPTGDGRLICRYHVPLIALALPDESPAVFALLGSRLRLCIHLFESRLKELPALIFPADRPLHRWAAIIAHFRYDNPWNRIIQVFPQFLNDGIDTMSAIQKDKNQAGESDDSGDFGSRLGTHIAHYNWVAAFPSELEGEKLVARFFKTAIKSTRALVISHIGSIWDSVDAKMTDPTVIARVMRIWELRAAYVMQQIQRDNRTISEYDDELIAAIDWFRCECFPFEWRFKHTKQSLSILKTLPRAHHLIKAITEFGVLPNRLGAALELLNMTLKKPSDDLRWSIQFKEIAPVIVPGLASTDSATRQFAIECRDGLLKMGFSEFLTL